jgi:polar amino acid transport system substrate-binding protein
MPLKTSLVQWLIAGAFVCLTTFSYALEPIRFCVDPDWFPFEVIDAQGQHQGIAADLLALVSQRSGLRMELLPTKDWPESLTASKAGRCEIMSLLNETPARREWLIFTPPLLTDENVLVTHEDHPFIADLAGLESHTMVLPAGTSIEERVRKDFPNIRIIITDTEAQALAMVSERKADLTMRSLIIAAYTIKHQGWFHLKIAGQVPGYANQLRIGVIKADSALRDQLSAGVASITPVERQHIIDKHISINATTAIDYGPIKLLTGVFALVVLTSLFWLAKVNRAKRLAEDIAAQQQKFINMLSHEVRTPLAVIDTAAQVLVQRLPAGAEVPDPISRIRRGVARLAYFFDNCLTADRLHSQDFTVTPSAIDIHELMTWARENAMLLSSADRIVLTVEPGLSALWGDPLLLRILVINLLSNALQYSPADTPIQLRVQRHEAMCCLSVENTGPGIPADELATIFQKYQRGRLAQGKPGAGLGLAVVKRIAELHTGGVTIRSEPGLLTRFVVEIPFGHR